jgi:hypothetical protein
LETIILVITFITPFRKQFKHDTLFLPKTPNKNIKGKFTDFKKVSLVFRVRQHVPNVTWAGGIENLA